MWAFLKCEEVSLDNLLVLQSRSESLRRYPKVISDPSLLAFEQCVVREGVAVTRIDHRSLRLYLAYLKQAQYSLKTLNERLSALRVFTNGCEKKLIATDPALSLEAILERHEIFHIL